MLQKGPNACLSWNFFFSHEFNMNPERTKYESTPKSLFTPKSPKGDF